MRSVTVSQAGLPVAGGVAVLVLLQTLGMRAGDALFLGVLLAGLLFVAQLAWRAHGEARGEQRRADQLRSATPNEVARVAVNAERERLSRDIETWLRDLLNSVAVLARVAAQAADPRGDCLTIQADAQHATSELRRQLGLLRPLEPATPASPVQFAPDRARLRMADVVLAALVATLALAEVLGWGPAAGPVTLGSLVTTTAVALSVIARRTAPIAAALVCSAVLAAGAVLGHPVYDGLWFATAIGILAWTLTMLQSRAGWLTLVCLCTAALGSRWLYIPLNVGVNAVCLAVAVAAAAAVARSRRLRSVASADATARGDELQLAADEAVRTERLQVARELHDLVSHAVSVVAVQAGAAELLWPHDPDAARRAIDVVESTARQTAAELDRLLPGNTPVSHTISDVSALVARMSAAGLKVRFHQYGEPPVDVVPTAYRVIQECLTNALRYASDGVVDVEVSTNSGASGLIETVVRVTTCGSSSQSQPGRRGYGLIGLGERVAQSGGRLSVNQDHKADSCEVTAVLPARRTAEAS
jgi:signal transduction histidine kinase